MHLNQILPRFFAGTAIRRRLFSHTYAIRLMDGKLECTMDQGKTWRAVPLLPTSFSGYGFDDGDMEAGDWEEFLPTMKFDDIKVGECFTLANVRFEKIQTKSKPELNALRLDNKTVIDINGSTQVYPESIG
jgi:hypothetical protein